MCAAIGFGQNILVIRWLGVEQYGVAAMLIGVNAVSANLVDIRLADLVTKLYFDAAGSSDDAAMRYRPSVIQVGALLQLALACALFVVAALLDVFLVPHLTHTSVAVTAILAAAGAQAISYAAALVTYVQRFGQRFVLFGMAQVTSAALGAAVVVYSVWHDTTVTGFASGLFFAAVISGAVMTYAGVRTYRYLHPVTVTGADRAAALGDYLRNWRFLLSTNVLGYTKLLHRAADVLLVGYLTDDRQTGLYKLARSLTDALYTVFDAASKVYQPSLFVMLRDARRRDYQHTARKLVLGSLIFTALLIGGEIVFLPHLMNLLFGPGFAGAVPAIIVLTLPFFFVCGLFLWIWPALIFHGDIGRYTVFNLVAVLVGQYLFGVGLYFYTADVAGFAIGYTLSYVMLYVFAMLYMRKKYVDLVPMVGVA